MNIRTVRTTSNNIITALEIASQQAVRVMKYEIEHDGHIKGAQQTADRMNKEIDGAVSILCTLYITVLDNNDKYGEELTEQLEKVNKLRVSAWDAMELVDSEKAYEISNKIVEEMA